MPLLGVGLGPSKTRALKRALAAAKGRSRNLARSVCLCVCVPFQSLWVAWSSRWGWPHHSKFRNAVSRTLLLLAIVPALA
eukprot:4435583-Alexandrium_andersonii.AAC.1